MARPPGRSLQVETFSLQHVLEEEPQRLNLDVHRPISQSTPDDEVMNPVTHLFQRKLIGRAIVKLGQLSDRQHVCLDGSR